jgi:hypothetical protein
LEPEPDDGYVGIGKKFHDDPVPVNNPAMLY